MRTFSYGPHELLPFDLTHSVDWIADIKRASVDFLAEPTEIFVGI